MLLILSLVIVIFLIVIATTRFNLHPFLSLIIAALIMGFISGMDADLIIQILTAGFGSTLSSIGVIIAFGTIIGVYLEKSGGTMQIAHSILKIIGEKHSALAMNITGFIVSIPVFCDSGFVILSRLNKALSNKTGVPLTVFAISLAAGLYATHVFVPPTPGPLAAAAALNANLGLLILLGLLVAFPVALSGYVWAKYIGKKLQYSVSKEEVAIEEKPINLPGLGLSLAPILIPIFLIALKSIADYPTHPFGFELSYEILIFIGNPLTALLIGVLLSFMLKNNKDSHFDWTLSGLKEAGVIILITGAGGAFGSVLRAGGIGEVIGSALSNFHVGILLPFVLAAVLKSAQGSSTVAIITTAAIIAPLLVSLGLDSENSKVLTVLAIGAGAMSVSHLNDSYFWVVAQFSDMDTSTALKSQSLATLIQGLTGIFIIYALYLIIG